MGLKFRSQNPAVGLLQKLVDNADFLRYSDLRNQPDVGFFITRLSDEERELLKTLKSDDIGNVRWPLWR